MKNLLCRTKSGRRKGSLGLVLDSDAADEAASTNGAAAAPAPADAVEDDHLAIPDRRLRPRSTALDGDSTTTPRRAVRRAERRPPYAASDNGGVGEPRLANTGFPRFAVEAVRRAASSKDNPAMMTTPELPVGRRRATASRRRSATRSCPEPQQLVLFDFDARKSRAHWTTAALLATSTGASSGSPMTECARVEGHSPARCFEVDDDPPSRGSPSPLRGGPDRAAQRGAGQPPAAVAWLAQRRTAADVHRLISTVLRD